MPQREPAITPATFATFGALLRYLRQRALLSRVAKAATRDRRAVHAVVDHYPIRSVRSQNPLIVDFDVTPVSTR